MVIAVLVAVLDDVSVVVVLVAVLDDSEKAGVSDTVVNSAERGRDVEAVDMALVSVAPAASVVDAKAVVAVVIDLKAAVVFEAVRFPITDEGKSMRPPSGHV